MFLLHCKSDIRRTVSLAFSVCLRYIVNLTKEEGCIYHMSLHCVLIYSEPHAAFSVCFRHIVNHDAKAVCVVLSVFISVLLAFMQPSL